MTHLAMHVRPGKKTHAAPATIKLTKNLRRQIFYSRLPPPPPIKTSRVGVGDGVIIYLFSTPLAAWLPLFVCTIYEASL